MKSQERKPMNSNSKSGNLIVVYPGRFSPFHAGHLEVYNYLCNKYGKDNVWVVSSNKTGKDTPLDFNLKKKLAVKMGVPASKFQYAKIPYYPEDLLTKIASPDSKVIIALGKKDASRLENRKTYEYLSDKSDVSSLLPYTEKMYVDVTPEFANGRSASQVRSMLNSFKSKENARSLFIMLYGFFDEEIFNALISSK